MRVANLMTRGENKTNTNKQGNQLGPSPFSENRLQRKTPDCKVPFLT